MEPFPDVRHLEVFPLMESKTMEFKESFSTQIRPRITEVICAFLNAKGGYVVCGVEDSERRIVGLKANSHELDAYIRWFDDFYHGKKIVDSDNNPLTQGELEAEIVEVVPDEKFILVVRVRPTPGKTYKTKEGITYWRLGASVYKLQESQNLNALERELDQKLSLANREVDQANRRRIAAEQEAKAAREEAKAAKLDKEAALQKIKMHGTELTQAHGKLGEYKRMLEGIREDSRALIGAAKGLEDRLDLYVAAMTAEILEKKAEVEEKIQAPWWKCW